MENAKKGKVDSAEEPREANDIFRELNEKRKMSARPGSAAAGTGKWREPRACAELWPGRVIYASKGAEDGSNLGGHMITMDEACVRHLTIF